MSRVGEKEKIMIFYYGVQHFRKNKGCYGQPAACSCGHTYPREIIKDSKWGHFDYIPLIPMGTDYYSVCPVCMNGYKADKQQKQELKQLLSQTPANVHFTPHMVTYADKKTFDFYLQDDATGEKIRILQGVSKYEVKEEYKSRLIKKKEIVQETSAL